MKRTLCLILAVLMLLSAFAGCKKEPEQAQVPAVSETEIVSDTEVTTPTDAEPAGPNVYDDGRARPSSCGQLKVVDGKLCDENGEKVMLRGASSYGLITSEGFLNEKLFEELSRDVGMNVFRLAMYTYGVGTIGYCTSGDKERHMQDIDLGVELAKQEDMYAIIDWHILTDGNPNIYVEDAKEFFAAVAEKYADYNNVLYEICNEPNGDDVDWAEIKKYAEQVIPVIREKDPDSVIIVGTPEWSRWVNQALADPLSYDNLLYAYHFYSASHKDDLRQMVEETSQAGLPIFVTEFGITNANGGVPRDIESADIWIDMLERENISYCMWSFSKVAEASAALKRSVLTYNGFTEDDYSETGLWLLDTIKKHNTK